MHLSLVLKDHICNLLWPDEEIFSNGMILNRRVLPSFEPSWTTWPTSNVKLPESSSRPFCRVMMSTECADVSATAKRKHV